MKDHLYALTLLCLAVSGCAMGGYLGFPASQPEMMRQCTEPPLARLRQSAEAWRTTPSVGAEFNRRRSELLSTSAPAPLGTDANIRSTLRDPNRVNEFMEVLAMAEILRDLSRKGALSAGDLGGAAMTYLEEARALEAFYFAVGKTGLCVCVQGTSRQCVEDWHPADLPPAQNQEVLLYDPVSRKWVPHPWGLIGWSSRLYE